MKKYELTDETVELNGRTLHHIVALKSFSDVKEGDLGGYVESESNLSQEGDAWVSGNARVSGDARVYGNAWVSGNARVESVRDIFVCYNAISSGRSITYTRSNQRWVTGCFSGTGEELIAKAYKDSDEKGKWFEKLVQFVENL